MAPKKTLLALPLVLFASLTAAQSLDASSENVWVSQINEQNPVEFNYTTDSVCNNFEASYEFNSEKSPIDESKITNTSFVFSDFSSGEYVFNASCGSGSDDFTVQAGELEVSNLDLNYEDGDSKGYPGETVNADFEIDNGNDNLESSLNEDNFSVSSGDKDVSLDSFDLADRSFSFEGSEKLVDNGEVAVSALDSRAATDLNIQSVWQFENLEIRAGGEVVTDRTVKYRHLSTLELSFRVTRRGNPEPGLTTDSFRFDGEDGWFMKNDQGSGDYTIEIEGRPQYTEEDLAVDDPYLLDISLRRGSQTADIVELTVEKDVEFSGRVLDVSNNRVNTGFEAVVEREDSSNKIVPFNTDDAGNFEQYFETDTVDMKMLFPEATASLSEMNVGKEDAGDISYQYYDNPAGQSNIDPGVDVRPVNLAAFVSNYPFQSDSLDTYVQMQYDTSDVDPLEVVVYECSQWTFDAEQCSSEWEEIDNNDINLASGSTWKADFPIDPLTSDRFATDHGVLQNAYLVGVPRGVGSSLSLQDSLDVSSTSLQSGDELSISGTVIDSSTDEGVEDAYVSLELVDGDNTVSFDSLETESDGSFEFSKEIEEAGEYTAEFSAEKDPYESFSKESGRTIDVFYETGLTVSSESDIDLQMGESSEIEFEIKNSGQSEAEDIELEVSGIDEEHYSLSTNTISSLGTDDRTRSVTLSLDKPEEYCTDPCTSPPTISLSASGTSAGETVENSASVYTNVPSDTQQEQPSEGTEEPDQEEQNQSSLDVPGPEQVSQMTGDFIESQSDMNLALGIILIFGAILAVTVRKRKEGGDDRTNRVQGRMSQGAAGSARGNVQRPDVSPSGEEEGGQAESEDDVEPVQGTGNEVETGGGKEEGSDESDGEFVCDTCGEEFDTESGLKLHEDALH